MLPTWVEAFCASPFVCWVLCLPPQTTTYNSQECHPYSPKGHICTYSMWSYIHVQHLKERNCFSFYIRYHYKNYNSSQCRGHHLVHSVVWQCPAAEEAETGTSYWVWNDLNSSRLISTLITSSRGRRLASSVNRTATRLRSTVSSSCVCRQESESVCEWYCIPPCM